MGKYLLVLKNSMQRSLVYRFNTFAVLIFQVFTFLMFFYLWSSIYRGGQQIGTYDMKGIITYYLLAIFLGMVIKSNDMAWRVGDEIRLGSITNYLLKPVNYFWFKIFGALGDVVYKFLIYTSSIVIIFLFFKDHFAISFDLERTIYFLAFVFLGLMIHLMFFYLVGISAFWFGFIFGFNFSMQMIVNFLSGSLLPLDLLPEIIVKIGDFLPFKYIMYVPILVFNGRIELTPGLFIVPLAWIFIFYILSVIMFKKGIKKYEGYGA
jgi:ABC-2 type transport system permease protein